MAISLPTPLSYCVLLPRAQAVRCGIHRLLPEKPATLQAPAAQQLRLRPQPL